jgi:hypothetical protein
VIFRLLISCAFVGFDLSAMAADVYDDAIVDIVGEESLITNTVPVKVGPSINLSPMYALIIVT